MDDFSGLALVAAGVGGISWRLDELDERTAHAMRDRTQDRPPPPTSSTASSSTAGASRPGARLSLPPIPRTFDAIFTAHGQGFPIAYLRSLAWHESRLKPRTRAKTSSATGLLQIIDVVRADHNRLHGTAYTRDDLTDPVVNVTVGAAALRRIATSLTRNHPNIPNLAEDWNNYRWAELITAGWNAGWSERAGLGRVARYLEDRGIRNVTVELVVQHAVAAGATSHLNAKRLPWWKAVARHYSAERARDATEIDMPPVIITRPVMVATAPVDASPVSTPAQVDPSPAPSSMPPPVAAAPAAAHPDLLDPYPTPSADAVAVRSPTSAIRGALVDPNPSPSSLEPYPKC
jgi:soluble lytic murein transglycosylase-like protein